MFLSTKPIIFLSVVCFLCQQWPQEHLTSIMKERQSQEGLSGLARNLHAHGLSPVPCPHHWPVAYLRIWAGDAQKAASGQAATLQPVNRRCFMSSTIGHFAFPAQRVLVPKPQGPCGMPLDFSASEGLPLIHFCTLWLVAQTVPLEG